MGCTAGMPLPAHIHVSGLRPWSRSWNCTIEPPPKSITTAATLLSRTMEGRPFTIVSQWAEMTIDNSATRCQSERGLYMDILLSSKRRHLSKPCSPTSVDSTTQLNGPSYIQIIMDWFHDHQSL